MMLHPFYVYQNSFRKNYKRNEADDNQVPSHFCIVAEKKEGNDKLSSGTKWFMSGIIPDEFSEMLKKLQEYIIVWHSDPPSMRDMKTSAVINTINKIKGGEEFIKELSKMVDNPPTLIK